MTVGAPCSAFATQYALGPFPFSPVPCHFLSFRLRACSVTPSADSPPPVSKGRHYRGLPHGPTMSYAYQRSTGASSLPSFNSIPSSGGLVNQACNRVIPAAKQWIEEGVDTIRSSRPRTRDEARNQAKVVLKSLFSIPSAVVLLWVFTLWWGERTVFQESIDACAWEAWETWVCFGLVYLIMRC